MILDRVILWSLIPAGGLAAAAPKVCALQEREERQFERTVGPEPPFEWTGPAPDRNLRNWYPLLAVTVHVGDVNGDGFLDFVLPASGEDLPPKYFNEGAVWVIDGATREVIAHLTLGDDRYDVFYLGHGTACGDIDGDGFAEVAAAYLDYFLGQYRMHVWYGPDLVRQYDRVIGTMNFNYFRIGDFDQDGINDVLQLTSLVPGVRIYKGPNLDESQDIRLNDPSGLADANFRMGDFDGDGSNDFAIGVPGRSTEDVVAEGGVWILFGPDYTRQKLIRDNTPVGAGLFGQQLAVGDVNRDGFDDLCVAPAVDRCGYEYCGEIQLFFGPELKGRERVVFRSPDLEHWPRIGNAIEMGDVDGDGWLDIVESHAFRDDQHDCLRAGVGVIHGPDFRWWEFLVPETNDCWRSAGFTNLVVVDVDRDGRGEVLGGSPFWQTERDPYAAYGRCQLLDFSSRDDWFSTGWPYPPSGGIEASIEVNESEPESCTLLVHSPRSEIAGFLIASFGLNPTCLAGDRFPGGDPTLVPALFLRWPGSGVLLPFSVKGSEAGSTLSIPFRRRLEGALQQAGLETLYLQAISFDSGLEHSSALGVNLLTD